QGNRKSNHFGHAMKIQTDTEVQISALPNDDLKLRLLSLADQLGFDVCRVTSCKSPTHTNEFREWLNEGAAGEMGYMHRGEEKRCDPQMVLPGARSIIVLALNYWQGPGRDASPRRPLGT